MIQIILFVEGKHKDKMMREVVPSVGDTIVIDCGEMVKVTEVNHQWDDPTFVQINSEKTEVKLYYADQEEAE
jgi:preprotein translocase subunit YajC